MSTIGWITAIIIWIAIAFWPARVADRKGHSFFGYLVLSLFFLGRIVRERRVERLRAEEAGSA